MASRIGFVGAGVMGHGMAARILDAGYALTVIAHRNRTPIDDLVARGASEAYSYSELADSSDIIVLCVSNSRIVENVVANLTSSLRTGMTVIDTGTSSPNSTRALAAEFAELGVTFVEAPVTGGVKQSAAGELGALVGADHEAFARIEPLLRTFCKTVHHFGAPGAGNTAKLLNNLMVFGIAALVTESFTKAAEAGIDWQKLYDVVICGSADSGVLRRIIGGAVQGDFKGYVFDVNGSLKDMRYFCEMSERMGGVTPLAGAVRDIYEQAVAAGHGERLLSELLAPEVRAG
ncbi:MAG: NAD(P)-dependent oxidoreductase [Gammaproteobacteria bacterium]|nr:NAD(P)-dependent oxidoreductase [Gammaproteobacteria bacterium]MDH3465711.1 NAD(P)-dependent oxidoreductase [Gammaproteobacteria bacterium]